MCKSDLKNVHVAFASPAQEADPLQEQRGAVIELLILAEPGRAAQQRMARW